MVGEIMVVKEEMRRYGYTIKSTLRPSNQRMRQGYLPSS